MAPRNTDLERRKNTSPHIKNFNNPHQVTAEQLGLDNLVNVKVYSQERIDELLQQFEVDLSNISFSDIQGNVADNQQLQSALDQKAEDDDLQDHINDKDNPHDVTAQDLGVESDKYFQYTQGTPSDEWTVTHNLGKNPSVMVTDSAGTVVEGEVEYVNNNELKIYFSSAFSGRAELN